MRNHKRGLSGLELCEKQQIVEETMINFEEELKKFHPSLEIEDAEDALYKKNLTDIADLVVDIVKEVKEETE